MTVLAEPDILCSELVRIFTAQGVEVQALQGLELRVERGEMVALVGASGSGKSTLLTILAGLDTPTAGVARVAGHDLVAMTGGERLDYQRRSVGFVWQQSARNLLPYLSAAENIGDGARRRRGRPAEASARAADELLELLDVARRRRPPSGRAVGRTAAARRDRRSRSPTGRGCCSPTSRPASSTRRRAPTCSPRWRRSTASAASTTLIVTHDPAVSEHVDRTVRIRDGRTSTETLRRTPRRRRGPLGARRRGVRGARPGRPHAAAGRVHRGARPAGPGAPLARAGSRRGATRHDQAPPGCRRAAADARRRSTAHDRRAAGPSA